MMITQSRFVSAVALVTALGLSVPAADALADQGRGRGPDKKAEKADKAGKNAEVKAIVIDRDGHLRIVREYTRGGMLPPGLAKRESLPPGLRKQLRERGALPPGLRKHLVPVHATLATRLPPIPPYYERYYAGDDLIVIDTRTRRIVVIIRDIWG